MGTPLYTECPQKSFTYGGRRLGSQQRSEEAKEAEVEIVENVEAAFLHGDGLAAGEGLLEVCLDGGKNGMIYEHTGVLEMEGQGAVVQVDGSHHGLAVIGQEDLGVEEAGGEAQNLAPFSISSGK